MTGTTCPNCNKSAMSCIKKLIMSPAMGFKCKSCGKVLAVNMRKALLLVFLAMVFVYVIYLMFSMNIFIAFAISVVPVGIIYCKYVPLVEAEENFKRFEN